MDDTSNTRVRNSDNAGNNVNEDEVTKVIKWDDGDSVNEDEGKKMIASDDKSNFNEVEIWEDDCNFKVEKKKMITTPTPRRNLQNRQSSLFVSGNHSLTFRGLNYSVPTNNSNPISSLFRSNNNKNVEKNILTGISGKASSGEVMAMLGPSGAGKTSLLNILTLHGVDGTCSGYVQLDGQDMNIDIFKENCSFVNQHDTLWPLLTTREHLEYAASFLLPNDIQEERECKINELLDHLDLKSCANVRASNLSGGQKRHLSLAIAMIKSPKVLFLDEPTSGLDSMAATNVVTILKLLAMTTNVIIICVIHQPSTDVFAQFDTVMILAQGHLVYTGENGAHGVLSHFKEVGYSLPPNTNPAEFLLDCARTHTDNLIKAWSAKYEKEHEKDGTLSSYHDLERSNINNLSTEHERKSALGIIFSEQMNLASRMFRISIRDIQAYFGRAIFFFISTIFISIFYFQTRYRTLDFVVERVIQIGWFFAIPSLLMIGHVHQSCMEYNKMSYEVHLGFYQPISYVLARVFVEIPFMFILSISALAIGGFVIGNLNITALWTMILLYTSMLYAFETTAQVCSVIFSDTNMNMLLFVIIWFGSFLFSEVWVAESDVFLALRPFFYISPFRLSLRAFIYLDFHTTTFSCGDGISLPQMINGGKCVGNYDGNMLLDAIGNIIFPTVTSEVNILQCLGVTILIASVLKIIYVLLIKYRLSVSKTLTSGSGLKRNNKAALYILSFKILASALVIIGVSTSVLIWISLKEEAYGAQDCMKSLYDLDYSLDNFESYEKAFNRNSTMILPQAGKYKGPDEIFEYLLFLSSSSAYLSKSELLRTDRHFLGYDKESGICSLRELHLTKAKFDVTNTGNDAEVSFTAMTRFEYNPDKQVIENIFVDLEQSFITYIFGALAKTDNAREFVCSVKSDDCYTKEENCVQNLAALPITEGSHNHVDGNSQGCRFLHAMMATFNVKHCAHLAFNPMFDTDGKIKCQESLGLLRSDLFDESDIISHMAFQKNVGIKAGSGYKATIVRTN